MRINLFIVLSLVLLVGIAGAQTVEYKCPDGMAVYSLQVASNSPITGTIELNYQDGTTVSGSWSYQPYTVFGYSVANTASITLAGDSKSQVFVTPGRLYVSLYTGRNLTELAENRLIMGAGQTGMVNNIAVEKDGITSAIIGFKIDADNSFTYTKEEQSLDTMTRNLQTPNIAEIMDISYKVFWDAIDFIINLAYWVKFFFIDNLALILALFLAVPMAFAAKNSKGNPERFIRGYFKTLKGFFVFIGLAWTALLTTIGTVRGWFRL